MPSRPEPDETFSLAVAQTHVDGVFLLKRTGVVVSSWSRVPLVGEVLPVMLAAMFGSLDTVAEVLGDPRPRSTIVETDLRLILATAVDSHAILFLIAPKTTTAAELRRDSERIMELLSTKTQRGGVASARPRRAPSGAAPGPRRRPTRQR